MNTTAQHQQQWQDRLDALKTDDGSDPAVWALMEQYDKDVAESEAA